tara:strand:+ start:3209 stop:4957 length:1749 start_codon:yes stop_codon:yes gene_type:complete
MTLNLSAPGTESQLKPRIVVVGVGGAGCNAVNNMISANLEGVEFVVANTDAQSLALSASERRIQLGINITNGLGSGARPDIGRASAEESLDDVLDHLQGSHMAFIAAGMGGGTGTGAAPVIARAAREQGILTVGVVTKPFQFEGNNRMKSAEEGIEELQHFVDTLIVIPNQNLFRVCNEHTTFAEAFCMADDVLHSGVRGVTDLMVMPGLINLDFADIRTVMSEMGKAMMGTGEASGEGRSIAAAESAIANPLLDDVSMRGARGVIINITGGLDMTLFEVDEAANKIREEVDSDANIIFGSTFDEKMEGTMRVSIVSTGIDADSSSMPRSPNISLVHDSERTNKAQSSTILTSEEANQHPSDLDQSKSEMKNDKPPSSNQVQDQKSEILMEPDTGANLNKDNQPVSEQNKEEDTNTQQIIETGDKPFIPPKPQTESTINTGDQSRKTTPDAFAEAAIQNGSAQSDKKRGRSLFQKVTGAVNSLVTEEQRASSTSNSALNENIKATESEKSSKTTFSAEDSIDTVSNPSSDSFSSEDTIDKESTEEAPTQTSLADLEPSLQTESSGSDDDLLEIPAFLRRQVN